MSNPKKILESMPDDTERNSRERRLENKLRIAKANERRALDRAEELEATVEAFAELGAAQTIGSQPMRKRKGAKRHGIAIVHWTDWHVAEVVSKNKTNGLNKFNPEICQKRVDALAQSTVKMLRLHRQDIVIDEVLLVLGGDFVTGYLHPELEQTNAMGTAEEAQFAIELLSGAINTFFEHGDPKKLRIVCHRGNHGRTTKKHQFKNDYETSRESLVYWSLRQRIQDDRIEWIIPESDVFYTTLVRGCDVRTCHGHQIKYGGGVGGLLVPANRWVLRQNSTKPAILTMMGHFHTRNIMSGIAVAGSIKGWDEYAMAHGFAYEPPTQSFMLFDVGRKQITASWPIFCEE